MSEYFSECLKKGKIREFSRGKNLAQKELRLAADDFKTAKISFKQTNFRWSIIQAYYSMFHAARALLYAKNYREKSHFCLIEAIKTLYVEKGILPVFLIEALIKAKNLREAADYYGDFSQINASNILKAAKDFINKVKELFSSG